MGQDDGAGLAPVESPHCIRYASPYLVSAANINLKQDQCMALKQQLNSINKVFEIAVIEAIEGKEKEGDSKK